METKKMRTMNKGLSFLNPVDVDGDYYMHVTDYAIKYGYNELELIGPTHHGVKGNCDGMIFSRKYSHFNADKDSEYINYCLDVVNKCTKKAHEHGIKNYFWHHELDLPNGFKEAFPEILNENGDIEVTHPIVKDYLENRLLDFFHAYPYMDGIVLTLHETKVPLLKLKNQKLDKVGRVKYVTEILYKTCKSLGKELIVRPFASVEEDYVMMTKAYEEISSELVIMDKWTQFDWSLTLPHNKFFYKIKKNPLRVETDIFGEYFGKGRLPLLLRDHIQEKFAYCEQFKPVGYISRIDRGGNHPFGEVNEVNLVIMHAVLAGLDVDAEILKFMEEKYGAEVAPEIKSIMDNTESILKKIIHLKGYYYSELSRFPTLNHSKNHFYFEMMKDNYSIVSEEWFIPKNWERGSLESVIAEKQSACAEAKEALEKIEALKEKLDCVEYEKLWRMFANLDLVARLWETITFAFIGYAKYFETGDEKYEKMLFDSLDKLEEIDAEGIAALGKKFFPYDIDVARSFPYDINDPRASMIKFFVMETKKSFAYEKEIVEKLKKENLYDYIVCGGGYEGHNIKKEVNFSDTLFVDDELVRICGNRKGLEWSLINAHGWFSYELKVKENEENTIELLAGTKGDSLDLKITLGDNEFVIKEKIDGKKTITLPYKAAKGEDKVRIRFDRLSGNTPYLYTIKVK